jgi:hypothetical protein
MNISPFPVVEVCVQFNDAKGRDLLIHYLKKQFMKCERLLFVLGGHRCLKLEGKVLIVTFLWQCLEKASQYF